MVLFMTSLLGLLMYTVRLYAGRTAAWCTVLVALCLPLFVFHGRFAFGHGTAIATSAIASLLFIGNARKNCSWLYGLAWMFSACAALSGGILAFAVPISVFGCLWAYDARPRAAHTWVKFAAPGLALGLIALGWWRAYVHSGVDQLDVWLLGLLQMNSLDPVPTGDKRPFFNLFVHQIGFGLFPFGALLPIIFADLCWNPDEHLWVDQSFVWCAMGFLDQPSTHAYPLWRLCPHPRPLSPRNLHPSGPDPAPAACTGVSVRGPSGALGQHPGMIRSSGRCHRRRKSDSLPGISPLDLGTPPQRIFLKSCFCIRVNSSLGKDCRARIFLSTAGAHPSKPIHSLHLCDHAPGFVINSSFPNFSYVPSLTWEGLAVISCHPRTQVLATIMELDPGSSPTGTAQTPYSGP